jgi:hypothetical protein
VAAAPTRHVDALGGDARYSPQRTRGTRKRLSTAAPRAQACALSRPAARRASAACVRLSLAHYQSSSAPLVSQPEACRCLKRGLSRAEFSTDQSIWPPRASQMWTLTSANVWDHSRNANLWERRRDLSEVARPAGFEPATLGLEGRGYEATGGSGKPLLPIFLGFSHTQGNPDPSPAATDCPWIVHNVAASVVDEVRRR